MTTQTQRTQTETGWVELLDPTGVIAQAAERPAERPASLAGRRLGLLDNTMGWSHVVLEELGKVLAERYGVAEVRKVERPNLSRPTPAGMLDELVAGTDLVVTGVGL
jgi:hypothetical protein